MRKPFICGNWKMHKSVEESLKTVKELLIKIPEDAYQKVDVGIAPVFTSLFPVGRLLSNTPLFLCAQDVFWEREGAFTGEISPFMLKDVGCMYCIVGHSERRKYFAETDIQVNRKVKALVNEGITPIICVGETLEERETGKAFEVVNRQLEGALEGVEFNDIVIAYEPVWAIGTGKVATPEQAEEMHVFIRERLKEFYRERADDIRILYGGSVKPENIEGLIKRDNIDGALVGGASLDAGKFHRIVIKVAEVS